MVVPLDQQPPKIGPYILRRLLGKGGYGQVYLAWKTNAADEPNPCVVKFPHSNLITNLTIIRRFLQEARLGMRLKGHPNIVLIIDAGRYGKMPYIVMEYLDCIDLGHLLKAVRKRRRPLSISSVCHILASIAAGLFFSHSGATQAEIPVRIVHRDVTPHNVLVTRDGIVKLADFGLGVALCDGTSGEHIKGTYRYMSPEHLNAKVCPEMDIYSFGALAWEVIEGRAFREGVEKQAHFPLIMNGHVPKMRRGCTTLVEIVHACLDPNKRGRPSAAELCDLIAHCEGFSRDPTQLQQDIIDIVGNRRSSGTSGEHLVASTELVATFAAVEHDQRNRREIPTFCENTEPTVIASELASPEHGTRVEPERDPDAPKVYRKRLGSPARKEPAPLREVSIHCHKVAEKPLAKPIPVWKSLEDCTTRKADRFSAEIPTQEFVKPPPESSQSDRSLG